MAFLTGQKSEATQLPQETAHGLAANTAIWSPDDPQKLMRQREYLAARYKAKRSYRDLRDLQNVTTRILAKGR
jgi:hypothetical protein